MAIIQVNKNPSSRELFWFAVILMVIFAAVGGLLLLRFDAATGAYAVWGAGAALILAFFAIPRIRRPLYVGWIYAFYPVGFVLSHVVMALIYYLVLTPMGLLSRVLREDTMKRRFEPDAPSYWVARQAQADPARYFRQF